MKGRGLSASSELKKARKAQGSITFLTQKLEEYFRDIPGIWLENKKYTLSLHFRNLTRTYLDLLQEKLGSLRKKYRDLPLAWRRGKKVWEIRPDVSWGKGDAALYLLKRFPKAFPIVIGDDLTDEDMFRALKSRGMTVRIGFSKRSKADYYLKSTHEVAILLGELCH
jgi:trehalose-phosphatase